MSMPTHERRYFLGLLSRERVAREAEIEKQKAQAQSKGGRGERTTKVSGDALKTRIMNGEIPTK